MLKYHDLYTNPVDEYVGNRLKLILAEKAVDHKALGISQELLDDYIEGYQRIGSAKLFEFSMHMEVPVMYFFDGYEPVYDQEIPLAAHVSPQLLLSSFYRAEISKRLKVIKVLKIKA